jgi:hypothetical protein
MFLILYQLFLATNIREGLENQYQNYDKNNPNNALILAQQNAGNISYLKERVNKFEGTYKEVQDISENVVSLQTQVDGLVQAQQDYVNQMTGGTAPEITGAIDDSSSTLDTSNLVTEEEEE